MLTPEVRSHEPAAAAAPKLAPKPHTDADMWAEVLDGWRGSEVEMEPAAVASCASPEVGAAKAADATAEEMVFVAATPQVKVQQLVQLVERIKQSGIHNLKLSPSVSQ